MCDQQQPKASAPIGNATDARTAALFWGWGFDIFDEPYPPVEEIGHGEDRVAYLINGTVYKVGWRHSANRYDHKTLAEAHAAGCAWAPPTTLYNVSIPNPGDFSPCTVPVLAMPLLRADGSEADPVALATMHAQTGGGVDWLGGNYVVIAGQPIVIDGCTVSLQLPPLAPTDSADSTQRPDPAVPMVEATSPSLLMQALRDKRRRMVAAAEAAGDARHRAEADLCDTEHTLRQCCDNGLPDCHVALVAALIDPAVAVREAAQAAHAATHAAADAATNVAGMAARHVQTQEAGAAGPFYQGAA